MDPHFSKLDPEPDPHSLKKLDPEPDTHKVNADPKHWPQQNPHKRETKAFDYH
jgi:hypothetical protein